MISWENERIVIALDTARHWSSDTDNHALHMLSETHKIHNEDHRQKSLYETIACTQLVLDRLSLNKHNHLSDSSLKDFTKNMFRLCDLSNLIKNSTVDKEWLPDADYVLVKRLLLFSGELG